jgi:ADP-ribosylglycohydrolase
MRVLPQALWHRGTNDELVDHAGAQSLVTHGHLQAHLCPALYCLWARRIHAGSPRHWCQAAATLRRRFVAGASERRARDWQLRPGDPAAGSGRGYLVDCLRSARWALAQGSCAQVVALALRLGNDTDTTACVAGDLAGLRDGIEASPWRWCDAPRGRELVQALLERLLDDERDRAARRQDE